MFRWIPLVALVLLGMLDASQAQEKIAADKSALEKDSTGWIDIFPSQNLKNWKRVGLEQGLVETNPWSVHENILLCQGEGAKEMFLYDKPFADGIFHLEWRFKKSEGKQDYNAGAYVRSLDGKVWHQIQIAHLEKPPFMGDLFGDMNVNGKVERVIIQGKGAAQVNPPGQWNTFEITAKGKEVHVWINGTTTLSWRDCAVEKGMIGMQAEFFTIEFRNLKFKTL